MFCTNCGRELPKDGKPCACGSGQAELVVQNRAAEQEWATESIVMPEVPEIDESVNEEIQLVAEAELPQPENHETAEQAAVEEQPAQQESYIPPVYVQQPVQPTYYAAPSYAVQQNNSVISVIRSIAGSPLFLIAVIIVSLHFVLNVVNRLMPLDITGFIYSIVGYLDSMMPGMGAEMMREIEPALADIRAAQATISGISMLGMITPALTLAALWMIYGSAKSADGPKTGGFTILQVLQILAVIGVSFGVLLALIGSGLIIALGQVIAEEMRYFSMGGDASSGITIASVIIAILLMVGVVFSLIYAIKVLSTIVGVKKAIRTGVVTKKASGFVAVISILSGVGMTIEGLSAFAVFGWKTAVLNLLAAAMNILFAVCIFKYNKAIKPWIVSKNAVPVVPPVYPQH